MTLIPLMGSWGRNKGHEQIEWWFLVTIAKSRHFPPLKKKEKKKKIFLHNKTIGYVVIVIFRFSISPVVHFIRVMNVNWYCYVDRFSAFWLRSKCTCYTFDFSWGWG